MYIDQNNLQDTIPKYDPHKVLQELDEAERIQDQKYKEETEPWLREYIKNILLWTLLKYQKYFNFSDMNQQNYLGMISVLDIIYQMILSGISMIN